MRKTLLLLPVVCLVVLGLAGAGCTTTQKTATPTASPAGTTTPATTVTATPSPTASLTFNTTESDSAILAEKNGQWAVSALASSTYGDATGTESWSPMHATGQPNVETYGDHGTAWAPKEKNKGMEYLEMIYTDPVTPTGVRIRESYGSGCVTKVELKDTNGVWHEIWSGVDTTRGLSYLQIPVTGATYKTKTVKITFDTTKAPNEWAEIDAVQLVGTK